MSRVNTRVMYELGLDTATVEALRQVTEAVTNGELPNQTAPEVKTAYESNDDTNPFTDADKSKLDGIEDGATGDQSAAEIKTAYELNSDTNAFTDALLAKLNAVESGATADQSNTEILTAWVSASGVTVANILRADGSVALTGGLRLLATTVAAAPTVGTPGRVIYVSNGDSGNPCLAVDDGSSWRRIALGAAIST